LTTTAPVQLLDMAYLAKSFRVWILFGSRYGISQKVQHQLAKLIIYWMNSVTANSSSRAKIIFYKLYHENPTSISGASGAVRSVGNIDNEV